MNAVSCTMVSAKESRPYLTRTEIEVNSPAPQQEDKYIRDRDSSLGNNPLTGAQLDASLNSAH